MCAVPRRVVLCSRGSGFSLTLAKVQAWSPPKFEILLFLKARKLAVGAAVHDAQSGFLSNFLDFEFATTAGAWIGIFRNCLGAFLTSAGKPTGSGRTEFSDTQGEGMERCCIAPRVLRGPRERSMPPKKKKGDKDGKGKDAKGDGDKPKAKATGPSASTHFLLLQQCVPEIFATTTVLTLARHRSPDLPPHPSRRQDPAQQVRAE